MANPPDYNDLKRSQRIAANKRLSLGYVIQSGAPTSVSQAAVITPKEPAPTPTITPTPTTDGAWAIAPFEAQFLKLYETTPKP